jgi:hypothetical protein
MAGREQGEQPGQDCRLHARVSVLVLQGKVEGTRKFRLHYSPAEAARAFASTLVLLTSIFWHMGS